MELVRGKEGYGCTNVARKVPGFLRSGGEPLPQEKKIMFLWEGEGGGSKCSAETP